MKISVDYDKTYSADPKLFDEFIEIAKRRGHDVVCVTMRRPEEAVEIPCHVIYTSRRAKLLYCEERGIKIDIWIDDAPRWLLADG